MRIIPAIDLKDGRCVRLTQGKADQSKVYAEDPVAMAEHWAREGAEQLHVVDLDGAFQARPMHHATIAKITKAVDIPVQVGGGIRTDDDIVALLDCGVDRVIIGTRAFKDPDSMKTLAETYGPRVVVGIDARDNKVQINGWVQTTDVSAVELAADAASKGIRTIVYTDTATDGMMEGTNVQAMKDVCEAASCNIIASGGISSLDDVHALVALKKPNLAGAIVGKALYEQKVTLQELQDAATTAS